MFDENLKKRLFNTYKFPKHDINKFISLLQKGVYPYEYMNDLKKFNELPLPEKQDFYRHLNMEDITDGDYIHGKSVFKDFEIKKLGEYYDLNIQMYTLLLADASEYFRNRCLEIYELDPAPFFIAPVLALQATLKKTKVKLDLLTDINMLLMVKKRYQRWNMPHYSSICKS